MNDRKLPFDDLPSAEQWLAGTLLNRQSASADRLLETTRLTDLIYSGCSYEDVYFNTNRADQPVNAEALAADIFAALYSPVLRRKDAANVNLRERLFNKPVLDRLLSDDHFDRMKGLCENKELPSYGEAASFAHSLNSALENRPYTPKVHYENADITIITDGVCRISDSFAENFRNAMLKYKATVTGILLDKDRPCGKTLEPFCDKIYHSKDITEEEIAQQIIRSRA